MEKYKLPEVSGQYRYDSFPGDNSWIGVGGSVDVLFKPSDISDLSTFLINRPAGLKYFVLGAGSNTLIRQGWVRWCLYKTR